MDKFEEFWRRWLKDHGSSWSTKRNMLKLVFAAGYQEGFEAGKMEGVVEEREGYRENP